MLKAQKYMTAADNRRVYNNMEKHQPEITLNNIMELNNDDNKSSDETCPLWVYGSIVIRDPETQKQIAKIPG